MESETGELPLQNHGLPESILDVALHFGIPLEHACGSHCACTTCPVIVREHDSQWSSMEEYEEDRLDGAAGLTLPSRLGCPVVVEGDATLEIPDGNRNYVREESSKTELR